MPYLFMPSYSPFYLHSVFFTAWELTQELRYSGFFCEEWDKRNALKKNSYVHNFASIIHIF